MAAPTSTGCGSCCATPSSRSPRDHLTLLEKRDSALLRAIATEPRRPGGAAIAAAREYCARELREMGFDVRERGFDYSEFAGRFATPLAGAAGAMAVGVAGVLASATTWTALPLVVLLAVGAGLWAAATWVTRAGVLSMPLLRRRGVNLEATRGAEPSVWLCAHLDSKSQPIPTLVRSAGIVIELIGFVIVTALAAALALGARPPDALWTYGALVTLVGAVPVGISMAGWRSPGAVDNAAGVATVLGVARDLGATSHVGVLLTDAEELGLAGARAWSRASGRGGATVLNCDGVDDAGAVVVMYTGRRPQRVLDAVTRAGESMGRRYETMRLLPGVLTDSVAFTDAGMSSVTFSRGDLRTLARIHTRRDSLANLRGTGIAETVVLMSLTVRALDRPS